MRWLSRLTTVTVLGGAAVVVALAVRRVARPPTVGGDFRTSALFRDAAGLPIGSRVVIAGVSVGQIERLVVEGNQARVAMRLRDGVVLCDDAWATKKATSALGDNYVEISPGEADPQAPSGCVAPHRRLASGEPVARVVEAASTDRVMRGIERAMPRLDEGLAAADAFLDEGRQWVSGPFVELVAQLDRDLAAGAVARPLRELDDGATRLEQWTTELEADVAEVAPGANRRLDQLASDVAGVTADLRAARADVVDGLGGARARFDEVDPFFDDAAAAVAELADGQRERPGRLARLIHDPELADEVASVTESGTTFTDSLSRLRTVVGFRTEVNLIARQPRFYVTAEVASRADQFYYIELEKGQWGDVPAPRLDDATGTATWTRRTVIEEQLRFTAQWGTRFGPLAVRAGLKESMFGAGVDGVLLGGRLKLSLDAMESSFDRVPRVKLAAALAVFRTLYIIGGVDDALIAGANLPIQDWPVGAEVPVQFRELHYGRDFFLGLTLNFNDTDMNRMLFVYGGLLGALLSR